MNRINSTKGKEWLFAGLFALVLSGPALADPSDPPGRVARLSYMNGAVSYEPAGTQDWVQADANRPLVTGDSIWADSDARAELSMGRLAARLDSQTSVTVTNLNDNTAQLQVSQGTMEVSVRRLEPGDNVEIDTPNLAFTVTKPGTYRLNVAADGSSTFVAVEAGQGNVTGQGQAYTIGDHQAYSFSGQDLANSANFDIPAPDDFDQFCATRERRYDDSQTARYVSPDVIGYEDLDNSGSWQDSPEYGHVWYPSGVAVDWAPYHDGRWAWVDPYGWTWVDAAPWGFAPFHYGRWAMVGPRWGWIPGPVAVAPVYAPALVAFVGGGGVGVSVSLGVGVGIGWFPLGPREIYRPPYAVGPAYVNRVNVSNTTVNATYVTNVVNNTTVVNNYVNQRVPGAVTAVPNAAFASGASVAKVAVAVPASVAVKAQVTAVAAVAPTAHSVASSPAASFHPPAATLARPVVAATAPPPAPVPFAAKAAALAKEPGRPLSAEATASVRASLPPSEHAAVARPVTVVTPPAAARGATATHAAPPSVARPATSAAPQAPARAEEASRPVARPPQSVARPPAKPESAPQSAPHGPAAARPAQPAPRSEEQSRPEPKPAPEARPAAPHPPSEARPAPHPAPEPHASHQEEHRGNEKKE